MIAGSSRGASYRAQHVFQIGANDGCSEVSHGLRYKCTDPVATLIQRGWSAILLEPQPQAVRKLRAQHAGKDAVHIVEAALCLNTTRASSTTLWTLNLTRNRGANESDPRCLGHLQTEMASLSKSHLLSLQRNFPYTPGQCAKCGKTLGRPLPPTSMSRAVVDNLEATSVPCSSIDMEMRHFSTGRELRPPELLVCDAEGHDDHIVKQYFATGMAPPAFLRFEYVHLSQRRRQRLATLLRSVGMVSYDLKLPASPDWGENLPFIRRLFPPDPWNALWIRNFSFR